MSRATTTELSRQLDFHANELALTGVAWLRSRGSQQTTGRITKYGHVAVTVAMS